MYRQIFFSLLIIYNVTLEYVKSQGDNYEGLEEKARLLQLLRKYYASNPNYRRDAEGSTALDDELDPWRGRWLPDRPGQPEIPPKVFHGSSTNSGQEEYPTFNNPRIEMGHKSARCDDAKTNLTVDWDGSPVNYTCYDKRIIPRTDLEPKLISAIVPKEYVAAHKCMQDKINYDEIVPTYGTHRPLWPVYGEYKFLPRQRWLHNLEHGAVVMLYHPCADPMEVKKLKNLVKSCLRRHIITSYNLLDESRPFILVTWGNKLEMPYVNRKIAKRFIIETALRGPEGTSKEGDFDEGLLSRAKIVSDTDDTTLCPNI